MSYRSDSHPFPAARLAALVRARGYSISSTALADRIGISRNYLHRLCTDPAINPNWDTLCAVCAALDCSTGDLVSSSSRP